MNRRRLLLSKPMTREKAEGLVVIILEFTATVIKTVQKVRKLLAGKKSPASLLKEETFNTE